MCEVIALPPLDEEERRRSVGQSVGRNRGSENRECAIACCCVREIVCVGDFHFPLYLKMRHHSFSAIFG